MGLTPDDIINYPLKQAVRGYSVPQVDSLLDQVADTVEKLRAEVDELRHRLRQSEDRLAATSETESTLKRTLVTAQRAAEQSLHEAREEAAALVDGARREAATLLEEAQLDAEQLRVEALTSARAEEAEIRRRRQSLEGHIEALRSFEREYRSRLRGHLEDQLRMLDEVQEQADGRGAPRLDDGEEPGGAVPVDPAQPGAADVAGEPGLRVRVRGAVAPRRDEGEPSVRGDDTGDGDVGRSDDVGTGDREVHLTDDVGEVGSRPSGHELEDEGRRAEQHRSVP